ncbi:unnamed protein product [Larinioides sclopetarius]|uniref:Uncharacterized protein n=1 Tax=Larinioides sclopetarius TaxID=280406 RepID=A0AAV2AC04_9ARAC
MPPTLNRDIFNDNNLNNVQNNAIIGGHGNIVQFIGLNQDAISAVANILRNSLPQNTQQRANGTEDISSETEDRSGIKRARSSTELTDQSLPMKQPKMDSCFSSDSTSVCLQERTESNLALCMEFNWIW